ncbi:MAG: alanine racemase [Chthoniobacterales bacterium]|nr:alanine racemase [Chthoniobacterales bacterium]
MKDARPHRCWAEIDLAALRHNAGVAHQRSGNQLALLAVIKANGYGHGLAAVAKALREDAQLFGVANLDEAIDVRRVAAQPVMILGPALAAERAEIVRRRFIPSVSSHEEAGQFSDLASDPPAAVACVIDTGMGRMGMSESSAVSQVQKIASLPHLTIHSVSSHLPSADEDRDYTCEQLLRFSKLVAQIRTTVPGSYFVHALPSAGVFGFDTSPFDIARVGLMLYGISPLPAFQSLLKPAMKLKTRVALVRDLAPGSSVSYGRTFITNRPIRVATIAAGYADGVPRAISNRGVVLIGGNRCPIIGRVTMDLIMVDVTEIAPVAVGDEVVLIGNQGPERILASEVAGWASTISWEIFTGIGSRVARVYV